MSIPAFIKELSLHLPKNRIVTDEFRRFALSTDASFYRLTAQAVVYVDNESEVIKLLSLARRYKVALTFRAAGTSLSGQAVTDQVLVLLTDNWQDMHIEPLGEVVFSQPGVIGAHLNRALLPYGRKIGPDPASINACKIGGIVANNASGMCCGTHHNSYQTLKHLRLILPDGSLLDSQSPTSVSKFRQTHQKLLAQLSQLRAQLLANEALVAKVRHKYRLKNTTGYGLNALLDFIDPIDILIHLMVGSEGTLGFISQIGLSTVEVQAKRASAMWLFANLADCAEAVIALESLGLSAVELLDSRAVNAVAHLPELPSEVKNCPSDGGVLLLDVHAHSAEQMDEKLAQIQQATQNLALLAQTEFSQDKHTIEGYWNIRKATFPAVGAQRETGTTVIIEDVAFPLEHLAEGIAAIQQLFERYDYHDGIIFGHALAGNLHFVFSQNFTSQQEIDRYQNFMADVTQLVAVKLEGSLKAEHGTGRNMAPFVSLEWGDDGFALMQQLKQLIDPKGILNPGVIINDNPTVHIENLKPMLASEPIIDRCIECGFCEPVCPSKELSLTPRQRIAVIRESHRRQQQGEGLAASWTRSYQQQVVDTCAATSMCALTCPVDVDTGAMVLKIRARRNHRYRHLANYMVRHFASLASWVRGGLVVAGIVQRLIGAQRLERTSLWLRKHLPFVPLWPAAMPARAKPIYARNERMEPTAEDAMVYWASCVTQSFAGAQTDDRGSITAAVQSVLAKAQLRVIYPQPSRGLCCGQPFRSKGHFPAAEKMQNELLDELWEVSSGGRYPVLADNSSCSLQLKQAAQARGIQLYDSTQFIDRFLLDRLEIKPEQAAVAVHFTCSSKHMGHQSSFQRVLNRITPNWQQPADMECCGFSGDKGFTQPELNAAALKGLGTKLSGCAFGISTSRTCEIGLSKHSGLTFYSLFEVLDKVSESIKNKAPE